MTFCLILIETQLSVSFMEFPVLISGVRRAQFCTGGVQFLAEATGILFSITSIEALGIAQATVQWVPREGLPRGHSATDVKLTPHLNVVPR
jgi:hypothetical protein